MEGGMVLIKTLVSLMMVLQEVFGGINMYLMKIFKDIKVANTKCIIKHTYMEEHMRFWRKGPWTVEEDKLLIEHVKLHGEGRWNSVARLAGLKRNAKSCRLRWVNYLRPDLKRGRITPHEEKIILDLHARWGNRWSTIARSLPGRTDNEIKNYWRTHFKKKGKMNSDDSAKLKARLLKRQKFQQEQHNQLQLQKNKEDMEKVLLLLEESNNKVVWRHQDMAHEEIPNVLYPMTLNDSQHVETSMNEDFVLWDGLWNLEDVPNATTKGCVPMPFF